MGYELRTNRGYVLLEVISALQKDIRRGNEEQAFYWALELVPKYEAYLWRRLLVIVNEDVGIANPPLLSIIPHLREQFFEFRERGKDGTCRLILANAILLMCRSPKSRISDEFQRVVTQEYMTGERREIPDYALDCHTKRGRQMGRGKEFWLEEGCILEPEADIENPYHDKAVEHWLAGREDAPKWGKRKRNSDDGPQQLSMF
jgi:replication-associated recombination protein RarA